MTQTKAAKSESVFDSIVKSVKVFSTEIEATCLTYLFSSFNKLLSSVKW